MWSEAFVFAVAARQIKMVELNSCAVAFVKCIFLNTRMKMSRAPPLLGLPGEVKRTEESSPKQYGSKFVYECFS